MLYQINLFCENCDFCLGELNQSPTVPLVWCKIFLIWYKNFDVLCKFFLIWFKKNRFGVKVLLFGVNCLILSVILSEYGVTFFN